MVMLLPLIYVVCKAIHQTHEDPMKTFHFLVLFSVMGLWGEDQ